MTRSVAELEIMENDSSSSRSLDSDFSSIPNKRPKTLTLIQSPISTSKGKEKIEEIKDKYEDEVTMDSVSKICGICLSEDGKAIRGWIDCCNHYFCFVCIMEWSKVESRCPMCKQRFSTIRRQRESGVFLRERIVNVPVRNQVWHPLGNETDWLYDPYAEVNCTECHGSLDEDLLLLCDLCDSAAHTYCVGLGTTVPEGDWYCYDCTVSKNENSSSQIDTDCCSQDSRNFNTVQESGASVSISEIIKESHFLEVHRSPGRNSSNIDQCSSPAVPDRDISAGTRVTCLSARTLQSCRNVHSHIQALRENWNALRTGSLSFSSNFPDSNGKSSMKHNSRAVTCDKSSQPQSSSFSSCPQMNAGGNASGDMLNNKGSYDIDRAWKMMNIAKSVQQARERTQFDHLVSNHKSSKRNVPMEATNASSSYSLSKGKLFKQKDLRGVASEKNYKSEKQKPSREEVKGALTLLKRLPKTHQSGYGELPSVRQDHTLVQVDFCHENKCNISIPVLHGRSSNLISGQSGTVCSISVTEPSSGGSDLYYSRPEFVASSSVCKEELPEEKGCLDKSSAKIMAQKVGGAKSEIQSLVKLNLKLLSRDKHLGVDGFKEVARLSTHTILAACGLEHTKSSVRPFPNSKCRHNDLRPPLRMSNLMPSSCRECFYVFVKDVVSSIMAEKLAGADSNC